MTGSAEIPMQVTEFVWVKRGISFCQNGGEWSAAEPQASGEGEGLYPGSLYVGNKSLILGSGAERAVDVRRGPAARREMNRSGHCKSNLPSWIMGTSTNFCFTQALVCFSET